MVRDAPREREDQMAVDHFVEWKEKGADGIDDTCVCTELSAESVEQCDIAPQFYKGVGAYEGIFLELHMDDCHLAADLAAGPPFIDMLKTKFVLKVAGSHLPGCEYDHLRRRRIVTAAGTLIRPRFSLAISVVERLWLKKAKGAPTPMVADRAKKPDDQESSGEESLDEEPAGVYRSCVGTLLYIALDRADISYPVKEHSWKMKKARKPDMRALRRVARFLKGTIGAAFGFHEGVL